MKYYAMIDGERRGPFELERLAEAGVRPSTYVWCKGMPDWQKAEDVADVCRMFRNRLHDLMHPSDAVSATAEQLNTPQGSTLSPITPPTRFDRYLKDSQESLPSLEEIDEKEDKTEKPASTMALAILSAVVFFPPTGIVAIYNSYMSTRSWNEAKASEASNKDAAGKEMTDFLRRKAHDYCRAAKMWTGITIFMGFILYAFLFRFA